MPIGGSGKTGRGLSRTGQPGGKRTGQRMGHYIEAGGDFERSAKALLADGWTVPYVAVSDPPKIGVKCKYTFACWRARDVGASVGAMPRGPSV